MRVHGAAFDLPTAQKHLQTEELYDIMVPTALQGEGQMLTRQDHVAGGSDAERHLHTYLHDHTAGAVHAVELLKALREQHDRRPALGQFAADILPEVEQDLRMLEEITGRLGADGFQLKEIAGWLGDKLSRVKLQPGGDSFHVFETLEFLSLGILGKRALWRALASIAPMYKGLQDVDFEYLIERAEHQYLATEKMRLHEASQAFGTEI